MIKKILAISLMLVIFLNILPLNEVYAQVDPYKDLKNWLIDNLNILGLTLYRGPNYPIVGSHIDPVISIILSDYNNKTSIRYPKTIEMKYSEFVNSILQNKFKLQMNITYLGYKRTGPITAIWPPFSFIYEKPFNLETVDNYGLLSWGLYPRSNVPDYSEYNTEAEPYTLNIHKWQTRNLFIENPHYLYSYLVIGNGSNINLPKGENILLALSPYKIESSIYYLLNKTLKGGTLNFPNSPDKIFSEFSPDDTFAKLLYITWEVSGNSGYLKYAQVSNYTALYYSEIHFIGLADGLLYNGTDKNKWYKDSVEYAKQRLEKVKFTSDLKQAKIPIFSPFGSPTNSITQIVDLSNQDAVGLFKTTSVFYIIDPNVYSGKDTIKLIISDLKERIKITYSFDVKIDKEGFSIGDIRVQDVKFTDDSGRKLEIGIPFRLELTGVSQSSSITTINSQKSYDEDGSLLIKLNYHKKEQSFLDASGYDQVVVWKEELGKHVYLPITGRIYNNYVSEDSGVMYMRIGGYLPSPSPSGFVFDLYVEKVTSSSIGYGYSEFFYPVHIGIERWVPGVSNHPCSIYIESLLEPGGFERNFKNDRYEYEGHGFIGLVDISNNKIKFIMNFEIGSASAIWKFYKNWLYTREQYTEPYNVTRYCKHLNNYPLFTEILHYITYEGGSREEIYHANYGWPIKKEYNLTYAQPIEISETPQIFILLDKYQAFADETINGYISSYGKNYAGSKVDIIAYTEFNNIRIPLTVSPSKVTIDDKGSGFFTLKLPSYAQVKSKFGDNMPGVMPVYINATDSRGAKNQFILTFNVQGYYVVLDFVDWDLNIPDDPWASNVFGGSVFNSNATALLIKDQPLNLKGIDSLRIIIKEKQTEKEVYSTTISSSRHVIIYDPNVFEKGKTYTLSYILSYGDGQGFKVKDAGIDITIPNDVGINDTRYAKFKVNVPYSLFQRYSMYAEALKGNDMRYKMLLADPSLVAHVLYTVLAKIGQFLTGMPGEDAESVLLILKSLPKYLNETTFHIGPKIALPKIGTDEAKGTELEIFSQEINLRKFPFNLNQTSFDDPFNYWSKLAKLIILEAELLRSYKYAESITLIISKLAALLLTLNIFQAKIFKTKTIGKDGKEMIVQKNLFQKFDDWFSFYKKGGISAKYLDATKIGLLVSEGAFFSILGLPGLKESLLSPFMNFLASLTGSKESASLLIAASFKLIRFSAGLLLSSSTFLADLAFEFIFQIFTLIIAHALMIIHNLSNQALILAELDKNFDPISITNLFFGSIKSTLFLSGYIYLQFKNDISYKDIKQLIQTSGFSGQKKFTWDNRQEQKAVSELPIYGAFEAMFYATADLYSSILEPIIGLFLSIVRGLDGIYFKLKDVGGSLFKLADTVANFKVGQTTLGKLVPKLYLAFIVTLLADSMVKILWNYAFYSLIVFSNLSSELFASLAWTLQALGPPLVAILTTGAVVKEINYKQFTKAITLNDEDAKSLNNIASNLSVLGSRIADMMQVSYYNFKTISDLIDNLNKADLLLTRGYYRITNLDFQLKLLDLKISFDSIITELAIMLTSMTSEPSSRLIVSDSQKFREKINSIVKILNNVSQLIENATINGFTLDKLGPLVIVKETDVYENDYPFSNKISVVVSNMGDEDISVRLHIQETNATGSYDTDSINIKPRNTEIISLSPTMKSNEGGIVYTTLLVYANNQLLYSIPVSLPLKVDLYRASASGIEVLSDGPVSIDDSGIKINGASMVQIMLPKTDSRYIALLNGKMIRTGEIYSDENTVLGIAFNRPVSGTISYKSIKQNFEYLEGQGSVKGNTGVTIESNGKFSAQINVLHDNPYPEASFTGAENFKVVAIDLLSVEQGYVTVKISFEDLGISDASQLHLYKYNSTLEAYQEVKNYQIDMNTKVVIFTLKPGDPVFLLAKGTIKNASEQQPPNIIQPPNIMFSFDIKTLLIALVIVFLSIVAALGIRKTIKKRKRKTIQN